MSILLMIAGTVQIRSDDFLHLIGFIMTIYSPRDWQISLFSMSDCIFILRGAETLILHLYSWWFEVFRGMIKIYESWLEILFITHFFLLTCELLSQLYLLLEPLVTLDKVSYISILYNSNKKVESILPNNKTC